MMIPWVPTETKHWTFTCLYHHRHPGANYAGCTCSSGVSQREKPRKEWTEKEALAWRLQFGMEVPE